MGWRTAEGQKRSKDGEMLKGAMMFPPNADGRDIGALLESFAFFEWISRQCTFLGSSGLYLSEYSSNLRSLIHDLRFVYRLPSYRTKSPRHLDCSHLESRSTRMS